MLFVVIYEVFEDVLDFEDKDWVEELVKKYFENKEKVYVNVKLEMLVDY